MNIDQVRADFEKWCQEKYNNPGMERCSDGYISTASHPYLPITYASVQMLWEAYQAGQRAALQQERKDTERLDWLREET